MQITTIGLDIAKNVFQVHGIDAAEKVIVRKQLRRGQMLAFFKALQPCLVGMEACATSHYWARELTKLGHQVRPVALDDPAHFRINRFNGVELLNLLPDGLPAPPARADAEIGRAHV